MKINIIRNAGISLLTFLLILPLGASAHGKGNDKKQEKREDKQERKIDKICWNRFLRGSNAWNWLRNNLDNINLDEDCWGKKPVKATTTVDTTLPVISDIVSRTGLRRALVIWKTDEKTNDKIHYSTTSPVNIGTASVVSVNTKKLGGKDHFAVISGLSQNTTYYAIIESKDKSGNVAKSSQFSFTTKTSTSTTPVDTTAPTIGNVTSSVASTSVTVNWDTNENATSKVYYSTTTPINTLSSPFVLSASLITNHSLKIDGLATGTLHYFLIESTDSSANTATSSTFSTTTLSN